MKSWRLNSIATRIAASILLAIILGIALEIALARGFTYFRSQSAEQADGEHIRIVIAGYSVLVADPERNTQMLSSRIATVAQILDAAPPAERSSIVAAMGHRKFDIALRNAPLTKPPSADDPHLDFLRQLITLQLGDPHRQVIVLPTAAPASDGAPLALMRPNKLLVEVALSHGNWLFMTVPDYVPRLVPFFRLAVVLIPIFVAIGLLSIWTARRLAAPIRDFAHAAERLGVDTSAPPLLERGPHELRTAIRAFNRMQERLRRFLSDRTQMLAAMSHDLRTPLARLRLRAEFVEDEEEQRKMFRDLEAMNAMIDSALAFMRDDMLREPRRLVDLGALVEDVCEDAFDAGGSVAYSGPRGVAVSCRPMAVRRAVTNLVDNAVKYAGAARVHLTCEKERVVIAIEDDGPGIPEPEQEKVFTPFYRLDPSRNLDTGGVGLGLSVARSVAREHGGDVTLANVDGGGLRACLELPLCATP